MSNQGILYVYLIKGNSLFLCSFKTNRPQIDSLYHFDSVINDLSK